MDVKKFIMEVKKRPAIYDVNCIQYNDRHAKSGAWSEVCEIMVVNWDAMTSEERTVEEKSLRNKWRNIRDYFMKELRSPRKGKSGSKAGRKRKKYWYHNELLFLVPNVKARKQAASRAGKNASASSVQRLKDEMEIHEVIELENSPRDEPFNLTGVSLAARETPRDVFPQHQTAICEASMASFDQEIATDVLSNSHGHQRNFASPDDDYDKMFLLSLLPSLRCVPEHMKLHVRIQMQQVIASAFHPGNHHAE